MAVKNTTQVLIDGKIITLGGYESPEYLQKVAAYLNQKISELSQSAGYNRLSVDTKHTLLALYAARWKNCSGSLIRQIRIWKIY